MRSPSLASNTALKVLLPALGSTLNSSAYAPDMVRTTASTPVIRDIRKLLCLLNPTAPVLLQLGGREFQPVIERRSTPSTRSRRKRAQNAMQSPHPHTSRPERTSSYRASRKVIFSPAPRAPRTVFGDLRPAYPVAVAHRNFGVTQALQSGLDLHLHGPAIVQIRHPQPAQAATSNGAKRAEVRRSQAISLAQPLCGDPVSSASLNGQRSRLRLALRTRSHDQVGNAGLDGLKKALQVPKIVAAIRVKKNYYLAIQGKCSQSCQARGAVSPPRFPNDRGSRTPRVRDSFINAAVVNHVNIPHWRPRNRLNHGSYGLGPRSAQE